MQSRRIVVRRTGTKFIGALAMIALVVAACDGVALSTGAPAPGSSGPAPTELGPTPVPSRSTPPAAPANVSKAASAASPSAAPRATVGATAQPSPSAAPLPAPSGTWRTVISAAMVYAGIGLAGNGDVIAIAAPFGAPTGKKYEIIRADPATGAIRSRVPLDKRVDVNNGLPFYVDPTTDNVVTFVWTGTYAALVRLDSKTGTVLKQVKPAVSIDRVAVDRQGRVYANTIPGSGFTEHPELLVRLGSDGKVAARSSVLVTRADQLDDVGKLAFGYYNFKQVVTYYGQTAAMAVSPNGTIQSLQVPADFGYYRPGCCIGYNAHQTPRPYFDTFKPNFSHLRRVSLPLEWPTGSYRAIYWESSLLRMAADDSGTIYLVEPIGPPSTKVEWDGRTRLRAIGSNGKVVATWGVGGNRAGLGYPQRVAIDESGRVWVVDMDPKTHRQSVKVLEPAL